MSPDLQVTPIHREKSSNDLCHVLRIMFSGVSDILMSIATMHTFLNYFRSYLICLSASVSMLVLNYIQHLGTVMFMEQ